ncbi:unnamed protein product [Adineta steineri]|uniref:Uncharacterized protein n=1 Tax=Adineta steineri TaxID=433720 RepID=A0A819KD71_9BILA|nr:unnamed protein product [Adineta steineri]
MSTFKRNGEHLFEKLLFYFFILDQDRYQHLNETSISTSKRRSISTLLLSTSQAVSIVQIYGMLSVTEDSNRFLFQIVTSSQILAMIKETIRHIYCISNNLLSNKSLPTFANNNTL